ncbi:unnamed protein product, partial [Trichobilharzia regenti]
MEISSTHHNYRKRNWSNEDDYLTSYNQTIGNSNHNEDNNSSNDTLNPHKTTIHAENERTTVSSRSISPPTPLQPQPPPVKRVANERERTRTASVNDAFLLLRSLIPTEPINRKLSKIETLRLASSYISHLHAILVTGSNPADQPCLRHQQIYYSSGGGDINSSSNINVNENRENQRLYEQSKKYRSVCTFCVTEMKHHQRGIT